MTTTMIEQIRNSATRQVVVSEPERIGSPSIGDVVRQGDVYLECISTKGKTEIQDRQLAPGNTQGSRHVLEGDAILWKENPLKDPEHLKGPSFHCSSECTVTHPEHGNKILPADTTWAVIYQRVGREERRVVD